MDTLNESGALTFDFGGQEVVLTRDDLLIDVSQKDGYVTEEDNYLTVVLDTNLTPELVEEALSVKSSARSRPCVRKPVLRSWTTLPFTRMTMTGSQGF